MADFMEIGAVVMGDDDVARKCGRLYETIGQFQDCFTRLEKVSFMKPSANFRTASAGWKRLRFIFCAYNVYVPIYLLYLLNLSPG